MRNTWKPIPCLMLIALLFAASAFFVTTLPAVAAEGDKPAADMETSTGEGEGESEDEEKKWDVDNPPGDWKTINIDTDELTWSNVDVSPDGATIVFDMLGDIYAVPISGGDATPLATGISWSFQPRYSPDGKRIAFISDRDGGDNLWVMNADGSEPQAVSEEKEHIVHNPAWSPDGSFLAARKSFTTTRSIAAGSIWLFHTSGGGGLEVIERSHGPQSQKNIAEPAFSPDGRYLYYSQDTTRGRVWQYNKDSTGQVFIIQRLDRDSGEVEPFVTGAGGAIRPTPSPDGQTLAFVRRTPAFTSAIFLKDLTTGREWAVYDQLDRDLQETNGNHGNTAAIAWTPDNRAIVFWAGGKLRRVDVATKRAAVIPVRVQAEMKVHPALRFPVDVAPDEFEVKMLRWAQRSPTGNRAVFQALGHLYVKDLSGGSQRRLTTQSDHFEFYPSISPDGRWIVYTTWDDHKLGSVRIIATDGGSSRVLTPQPGHYIEPRFSADGNTVVYRKITGGYLLSADWSVEPGIYVVPTAGGTPKRIVDNGYDAHFGADTERVYFSASGELTETLLKSVNLEGHDERTHLEGAKVTELRVSPDGKWVAFTEQYNAYIAPFVATGKKVDVSSGMSALPVQQVSKRAGEFLHWSADSTTLHWSHGATLYSRDLHDAFAFLDGAPDELPEPVTEGIDLRFTATADKPSGRIALVGGRVVTMRDANSTQEVIENGTVLIEGNRIVAVGPADAVTVPADAEVIDVAGKTVIPGLVDVHAHGAMANSEIIPQQNREQYGNLAFGVTATHDPSNDTSSVFATSELQRSGQVLAPRIYSTGTILYGAHVPGITAKIDSYEDAKFHVQRLKDVGAITVKSYNQPRRDQRQKVIAAGVELGIMVVPEGGAKYQHNMTMVVDGHTGVEHCIPIAFAYDDMAQLWSQTEVGYTPTLGVAYGGLSGETYWYEHTDVWRNERLMAFTPRFLVEPASIRRTKAPDSHYNHFHAAKIAKNLRDRGVPVLLGAHGQREGLAAHWELWMFEQGGFTPWEALRAGTIDGAHYVGLDGDIGSIEVGKLADLAVIDGNPLTDLRRSEHVTYTVLNGRVYDAATMNQIAPDQVERDPFFFEKEGGDTIHPTTAAWFEDFKERHGWVH